VPSILECKAHAHTHTHTHSQMCACDPAQTYLEKKALAVHRKRKRKQIQQTPKRSPSFHKEGGHIRVAASREALKKGRPRVRGLSQSPARLAARILRFRGGRLASRWPRLRATGRDPWRLPARSRAAAPGCRPRGRGWRRLAAGRTSARARLASTALRERRAGSGSGEWAGGGREDSAARAAPQLLPARAARAARAARRP
jgi:hypothetical protein